MRKITISVSYLIAFLLISTFYNSAFAQNENYSIPAKWELYSVKDKKVSFLMPRLPILISGSNQCRGEASQIYAAYTDGVVFSVEITFKVKTSNFCTKKKEFDETNFSERVQELKRNLIEESNSAGNLAKDTNIKLTGTIGDFGTKKIVSLINDFDNKRWFELTVSGADESNPRVKEFLASIKPEKVTSGIEIGQGAERVFGDEASLIEDKITNSAGKDEIIKKMLVKTDSPETKGIMIIMKPRANYTDAARQNRVMGKVILRVTFQANGAIGEISVVPPSNSAGFVANVISGSDYGLIEESMKAARKIIFIPAQKDGSRYSVTKIVEYGFSIY